MTKTDRRVERTRELLQKALMELIAEKGYDAITIRAIVDRAGVGRTTFYLHYDSKDDLFMSCHEAIVSRLHIGLFHPLAREDLLSVETSPEKSPVHRHLEEGQALLYPIFQGRDSQLILRKIRERSARELETNLRAVFAEADCAIPLDMLANYLAGAQIALMQWWLEKRRPHSPEALTRTLHTLQRAAIREAFGLSAERSGQSHG